MGTWLREIRTEAGLNQDEVAERMGMHGKGRSNFISALEVGRVKHPYFETIVYYLLTCGMPVGRFCNRFNTLGLVPVQPDTFEDTEFDAATKRQLQEKTASQVDKFQRRIRFPRRGRRLPPEEQQQRAESYVNYQIQVQVIQQAVKILLGRYPVPATEINAYLCYARMVLSRLRRHEELELRAQLKRAADYIGRHGLNEALGRRIQVLVVRRFTAMREQDSVP